MNKPEVPPKLRDLVQGPPSGYFVMIQSPESEGEIEFAAIFSVVLRSWKLLLGFSLTAAIIAAVISLQIRPVYRATTLVTTVTQRGAGSAAALRGQLGGLAALAGIDVGSGGGRREESLATLTSAGFARDFIAAENLMPVLFPEKWDAAENRWRADETPPSVASGVRRFTENVLFVSEDRKTGLITVAVEWYSPTLAAQWANRIVEQVNERLRADATRNAERSIDYLNRELAKSSVVELHQAIYTLIEEQVNNAMTANVQREYAFRIIDPAVPPEYRVRPRRSVIVIVAGLFGGFAGLLVVYIRHRRQQLIRDALPKA